VVYTPRNLSVQAPQLAQARQLLASLDNGEAAKFGYRSFDDHGDDPRLAVKAFGTLDCGIRQHNDPAKNGKPCCPARLLSYMQGLGAGAFFVVNKLDGTGQRLANVTAIRALYVDADSRPEVERLHAFIATTSLTPTALVASGGVHDGVEKLQAYWRVSSCPVAEFTRAQLSLVSRIGTDPAVQDASRVMRLPGYWHQKGEPRQTHIVSINPAMEHEFFAFMARVLAQPQIADPWAGGKGTRRPTVRQAASGGSVSSAGTTARLRVLLELHGGYVTPAVRALLHEAKAPTDGRPGNRHETLKSVVARSILAGWSDDDIRTLVLPVINGEWGEGDWTDHIDRLLDWTRAQEAGRVAATTFNATACSGDVR
jgi:RepB DNA-primase from phage plasmid